MQETCPGILHPASCVHVYPPPPTQMRDRVRGKKQALLAQLRGLPDMCMVLSWQVASGVPGLGALLRKYAPHDTYTLWKKVGRQAS